MIPVNLLNPFLKVRNYIQDKNGNWKPKKDPTLKQARNINQDVVPAADIVVFEEWDKKVVIDTFEFSINGDLKEIHAVLNINKNNITNNFDDQLFYTVNPGGTRWVASPERIANDGSSYFEIVSYDSVTKSAKFMLKRPIELPSGGRLAIRPSTTYLSGGKAVYKTEYRVFE